MIPTHHCLQIGKNHLNIILSVICLQETWITGPSPDVSLYELPGYKSVALGATCSSHGGLIMYIHEQYAFVVKNLYDPSSIWEGQFIEISGGNLNKSLTLCNIYRPPRKNNNNESIEYFIQLISPIVQKLNKENSDTIFVGDFNIDLLQIYEREKYSDFLDLFMNNGFFPKITLPTRFARKSATLID